MERLKSSCLLKILSQDSARLGCGPEPEPGQGGDRAPETHVHAGPFQNIPLPPWSIPKYTPVFLDHSKISLCPSGPFQNIPLSPLGYSKKFSSHPGPFQILTCLCRTGSRCTTPCSPWNRRRTGSESSNDSISSSIIVSWRSTVEKSLSSIFF